MRVASLHLFSTAVLLFCVLGCGSSFLPTTAGSAATASHHLTGGVHGGQQPVSGASIQLYAVGTAGDGSASRPLLTRPVTSDANGSFDITGLYACDPGMLVYLTATGGNPGLASVNPNLALMVALGPCANLDVHTFVSVNELTTVAAVNALAPYMTSLSAVGSTTFHAGALATAFAYAGQLVDTATGSSPGKGPFSLQIAPVATLNTLANILSSCVNSGGGRAGDQTVCGTLFSLSTPSGLATPVDTVAAALAIALHPALNTTALFGLATSISPFQPTLSLTPTDFAIAFSVARTSGLTTYHAYGDSITFGFRLQNPATQAYPYLFAQTNGLQFVDYGASSTLTCDLAPLQIFPNADSPAAATPSLYSVLIGTNDADDAGMGAYETTFNLCHQAAVAWLALPRDYKVMATDASVQTSGATHVETGPMHGRFTDALGATLSFPFQQSLAAPVYVWYRITDSSTGSFTYAIDGRVLGSLTTAVTPAVSTPLGTTSTLALLRIPNVGAGNHTLIITQTSNDPSGAGIVAVATLPLPGASGKSRTLVGTVPTQGPSSLSKSPCASSAIPCATYSHDILANVELFAGDGLDVELFNPSKYLTNTKADMADAIHPNAVGHEEIAHALEDVYQP